MKLLNISHKIFCISIFVLSTACASFAATPAIFFSDLTDGPNTGWENSSTKGAAVSIWGVNFGASRGTSYVTVGGVSLKSDTDYAEWGATTNPTTARDMQRITFYLNSSMSSGENAPNTMITVTTSEGASSTIPFHVRSTGNIYYVDPNGSNSNSGDTVANAWLSPQKCRETMIAGDVAYFKGGIYDKLDTGYTGRRSFLSIMGSVPHNDGTAWNTVSLVGYPGEKAIMNADGSSVDQFVFHYGTTFNYWTISKLVLIGHNNVFRYDANLYNISNHLRIVGNDITTNYAATGTGIAINPYCASDGYFIYGNYFHGVGKLSDDDPHGYKVQAIYYAGGGQTTLLDVAWNEFYRINGSPLQVYGHFTVDNLDLVLYHDNFAHECGRGPAVIGGGNGSDYVWVDKAQIYNNIFTQCNGDLRLEGGPGTGGTYYVYNNILYKNASYDSVYEQDITSTSKVAHFELKNNIVVSHDNSAGFYRWSSYPTFAVGNNNILYNTAGGIPPWEVSPLKNTDPLFINSNPVTFSDFKLQETSPAKNAGITPSFNTYNDIVGTPRSQYDIGVYQYTTGTNQPRIEIMRYTN